mgnify:CR=1 FL=1
MYAIIANSKNGKLLVEWNPYYTPYSMVIHKVAKDTQSPLYDLFFHQEELDSINKLLIKNNEVHYEITNKNLNGVGNDTHCIGCEFYLLETSERYYIDFVNKTIRNLTEEEEKKAKEKELEEGYSTTKEKKVIRIGKVNYAADDNDFTIYDDGITTLVIDWVNHKYYQVDQSYFIPWSEDEELDENILEEKFFKESTMMTYDYRQKVTGGYYFVTVKKDVSTDEEG